MSEISGSTFDESIYFEQTGVYPYVPESISAATQVMPDFREDEPKKNYSTAIFKKFLSLQYDIEGNWMLKANCRKGDPEVFFADGNADNKAAIRLCDNCTVKKECLEFALEPGEKFGIWGGMTTTERVKYKK